MTLASTGGPVGANPADRVQVTFPLVYQPPRSVIQASTKLVAPETAEDQRGSNGRTDALSHPVGDRVNRRYEVYEGPGGGCPIRHSLWNWASPGSWWVATVLNPSVFVAVDSSSDYMVERRGCGSRCPRVVLGLRVGFGILARQRHLSQTVWVGT
jgi:hypothetical protein